MQRVASKLKGYSIGAKDGDIGSVEDFVFDDKLWTVRYLVADTAKWLPGRRVLLSPIALGRVEVDEQRLPVSLTKQQVENSPDIDSRNITRTMRRRITTIMDGPTIGLAATFGGPVRFREVSPLSKKWKWLRGNRAVIRICAA